GRRPLDVTRSNGRLRLDEHDDVEACETNGVSPFPDIWQPTQWRYGDRVKYGDLLDRINLLELLRELLQPRQELGPGAAYRPERPPPRLRFRGDVDIAACRRLNEPNSGVPGIGIDNP